jgi:hypothetical protein
MQEMRLEMKAYTAPNLTSFDRDSYDAGGLCTFSRQSSDVYLGTIQLSRQVLHHT